MLKLTNFFRRFTVALFLAISFFMVLGGSSKVSASYLSYINNSCIAKGCTPCGTPYTQCGGAMHLDCDNIPDGTYTPVEVYVETYDCGGGCIVGSSAFYLTQETGNPCSAPLPPAPPGPCDPNDATAIARFGPCPAGVPELEKVFTNFLSVSVGIALIILVVMLTISGIKFLTSGGEPKAILFAQQTATWAIVGVVLLAVAWLVLWLIYATTGIPVHKFCIGVPPVTINCP